MKKLIIAIVAVLFSLQVNGQGSVAISNDGSQPHSSAKLDVQSTIKGFLPPVMTEDQRDAIENPVAGLQIHNLTTNLPNYYNGTEWKSYVAATAPSGIVDGDGNVYTSVVIGSQEWLVEDLKTTKYNDGSVIPFVAHDGTWAGLTSPACTFYDAEAPLGAQDNTDYGYLYNWYVVDAASNGSKNVCPVGWHVPTDAEWIALEMELGMTQEQADALEFRGTNQGSQLAGNADLWTDGVLESDVDFDISGFSALSGGSRNNSNGLSNHIGTSGVWWCSTEYFSLAWYRSLNYNEAQVYRFAIDKSVGFSVRCLKD